jgi:hypothetical protein
MTKAIIVFVIIIVLWGGWHLFLYWDKVNHEEETSRKQGTTSTFLNPDSLPGLPSNLEASYRQVEKAGPAALRAWLKANGPQVRDPRKAWIELDYCLAISREDPAEARRIYNQVRDRTPASSPVWPRIRQLEKTYK